MITNTWWILFIFFFSELYLGSNGYKYHSNSFTEPARACGDHLADVLALVCKDRGYNVYFSSEEAYLSENRRQKRGIVEECCHSGCSYHTLEQYCKPITTETPDNSQIRKRSDNDKSWPQPVDGKPDEPAPMTKNLFFHQRHSNYVKQQKQSQNNHKSLHDFFNDNKNGNINDNQPNVPSDLKSNEGLLSNLIFSKDTTGNDENLNDDGKDVTGNEENIDFNENRSVKNYLLNLNKNIIDKEVRKENIPEQKFSEENLQEMNKRSKEIIRSDSNKPVSDDDKNKIRSDELISDSDKNSFPDKQVRMLNTVEHSEKIRHNHDRHHLNNMTSRKNNHVQKDNMQDNMQPPTQQKQETSNNRFSRVGIVSVYFLGKELVHPNVRPSPNFSVNNLRQPIHYNR